MKVYLNEEAFQHEVWTYLKAFFPNKKIEWSQSTDPSDFVMIIQDQEITVTASLGQKEKTKHVAVGEDQGNFSIIKKKLKKLMFEVISELYDQALPWGILTGIRPTKVLFQLMKRHENAQKVRKILMDEYKISPVKIDLMFEIFKHEKKILEENQLGQVNLYLGIPFCPTKCLYCSFTSYPLIDNRDKVSMYLKALMKELDQTANKLLSNQTVRTIYIGGGTPTTLTAEELDKLLESLVEKIDFNYVEEFTVEAGRPDTITKEKLQVLKRYGVDRISINPQTMNQKTLDLIGRSHRVHDIEYAYELAKTFDFTINMDLILGLPGENVSDVEHTMYSIRQMNPDNITVHTMAIKRGSKLKENQNHISLTTSEIIEQMLNVSYEAIRSMGLLPYYMYRQKNMLGNFENVGYAKPTKNCIYNVEIIEEQQSIIALGAGAVSKVVYPKQKGLKRIENVKNINDYINRIDEMIDRKMQVQTNFT